MKRPSPQTASKIRQRAQCHFAQVFPCPFQGQDGYLGTLWPSTDALEGTANNPNASRQLAITDLGIKGISHRIGS